MEPGTFGHDEDRRTDRTVIGAELTGRVNGLRLLIMRGRGCADCEKGCDRKRRDGRTAHPNCPFNPLRRPRSRTCNAASVSWRNSASPGDWLERPQSRHFPMKAVRRTCEPQGACHPAPSQLGLETAHLVVLVIRPATIARLRPSTKPASPSPLPNAVTRLRRRATGARALTRLRCVAAHRVDQLGRQHCAGGANWMAMGHGTAFDVVLRQPELTSNNDGDGCEGFIDLGALDGANIPTGALQGLLDRRHGSQSEHTWFDRSDTVRDQTCCRGETAFLGPRVVGEHHRRSGIVQSRGVAGGDGAVWTEGRL
jgi:hypothetical protein